MPYYVSNNKVYFEDQSSNPGLALETPYSPGGTYGNTALPTGLALIPIGAKVNGKVNASLPGDNGSFQYLGLTDPTDPRLRGTPYGAPTLPDQPGGFSSGGSPTPSGGPATVPTTVSGLSTSLPTVNTADITQKTTEQYAPSRKVLGDTYASKIADAQGLSVEQERALNAQLGTKRRFSSSAAAFVQFTDDKNKKAIADLELQRDNALTTFDFNLASLINDKIKAEKDAQQQEFDNTMKLLDYADKKQAETDKKNADIALSDKEKAVIDQVGKGVTDAATIFQNIKDKFKDLKISEISDVLTTLNKQTDVQKSISDLLVKLGENNAPKEVISAVSGAKTLADAVNAAGGYLTGTSGIVGEYMFYKRQQEAAGKTAVDFNTYQNLDANRKAKVAAAANAAGIDPKTATVIGQLGQQFDNSPIVKNFNDIINKKLGIDAIIASGSSGPSDLALVYDFMKALDPTSVVRESEYASAAKSGNIFSGWAAKFNGYFKPEGGLLSDNVKQQFQSIVNTKFAGIEKQYDNLRNQFANQINTRTGRKDGSDFLIDYKTSIIQQAGDMKDKIATWASKSPDNLSAYTKLVTENPDMSDSDVFDILGIPQQ